MDTLRRIVFVALDGDAPPGQSLDQLPAAADVAALVEQVFSPFLTEGGTFETAGPGAMLSIPDDGTLQLVYAYGHAWLTDGGPTVGTRHATGTVYETAPNLLQRLIPTTAAGKTILILDCCHAAAFDPILSSEQPPRLAIYASGVEESAIALPQDKASRLLLALSEMVNRRTEVLDLVQVIGAVAEKLAKDGLLLGQDVDYRMNGRRVRLARTHAAQNRRRERSVALLRNLLLAGGGGIATIVTALGWFYWSHALVEIDLGKLGEIASNIGVVVSEEDPERNTSTLSDLRRVDGQRVRFWVPASNIIIRVEADYSDKAARSLAFPMVLQSSFSPGSKLLHLATPPSEEIASHPRMAYVPRVSWFHGRDNAPLTHGSPFWIELRPPSVEEYLPIVYRHLQAGEIDRENSFVLTAQQRRAAVDATGTGQLRQLNKDLSAIFGKIEQGTSPRVGAASDIVVGLGELPCPTCPAPMTRFEAELYCASRKMRLPTDLEWELAARGVDGRVFPWGNQFDAKRANVPGLPQKGDPPAALKPVDAYPGEKSPFGLVDTVGNAGDWVVNTQCSYERIFMGATYRYNPEDATTFRVLPITDSDYMVREITARCVDGPPIPSDEVQEQK